jgi:phage gp45-like
MHRQTPLTAGFVGYTSGGARALVDKISDNPLMQEMKGTFMQGEARDKIESPQNYGFTSVVKEATKGKDGMIEQCAEAFLSFLGGNRSFPIATVMDDRRYRLKELKPGDVAIFDWLQHQLHFNKDGVFLTGRTDKKMKFQLAPPPQQQQSSSSGSAKVAATAADSGGSDSSSSQSGGQQKPQGQKQRYETQGQQYLEMTKDTTNLVHDQTINYKTGTHTFSPPDGATTRAAGPLVKIMGDKFTQGFGEFTKQVSAADPILAKHLTTKKYVDALIAGITGGGGGGGGVSSAAPPMAIDGSGNLTLSYQAPLYLNANVLGLQIAAPLMLDGGGHLTSSVNEAPNDGQTYGRKSLGWSLLDITVDWTEIIGKPATFPPTLPIPESGVTNLIADLGAKEDKVNKGAASGYAPLDATSKVPAVYLPAYVDDVVEFANLAAFPATGMTGIIYVALDTNKVYRWSGSAYVEISPSPGSTDAVPEGSTNLYYTSARATSAAPVQSVSGRTGAVTLTKTDVGLGSVDNTSDASKPISTATQTALTLKADLASPVFTGDPRAPTPAANDNDNSIATTAFVTNAVTAGTVPPATVAPLMDGVAAVGTATKYAREDHKHPTDTSREPTITAGTTAQYWRGDKAWITLDKTAVGLGNVDNTSDASKPVSTATQTALNLKEDKANKGVANGYASLDASAKVLAAQLPTYGTMANQNANAVAITGGTIDGIVFDCGTF